MSPPVVDQPVRNMPLPSRSPTPWPALSTTSFPLASTAVRSPWPPTVTMKNAANMPRLDRSRPQRTTAVTALSPIRWNSTITAMTRLARNMTGTNWNAACTTWLNGSSAVLKWL